MNVLGIHDGHDAGAALLKDNNIVAAVNEERIIRKKLCWGFPLSAIKEVLDLGNLKPEDIDIVAIATKNAVFFPRPIPFSESPFSYQENPSLLSKSAKIFGGFYKTGAWTGIQKTIESVYGGKRQKKIREWLKKQGFNSKVVFCDHHMAHAASAYYTSGKKRSLVITSDGSGDSLSSIAALGENGRLEKLSETGSYNSLGKFYEHVTFLCGFKPNKHEGKITGLAAFGRPIYENAFAKMIDFEKNNMANKSGTRHGSTTSLIKKVIPEFTKEDLSASIQNHTENAMTKFVKHWFDKTQVSDISTAGGLFANVKLNQKILEIPGISSFFVHPHMGDGGLALGAALLALSEAKLDSGNSLFPEKLENVYFGRGFSNQEIEKELNAEGIKANYYENAEEKIAELAASGKIIGRYNGRMEYGPRALGNRTIIANPTDRKINDWLNKKLHRTEFMPFAPAIMESEARNFFENYSAGKYPAQFMTITFNVNKEQAPKIPAVVHVDNTARPQTVTEKSNPSFYKILKAYNEITGLPAFINTSFNIHEEPIVFTPNDAIRSFKQGAVDVLAAGNWIAE